MLLINGKSWNVLSNEDVLNAINEIEESFFFEFKEDGVKPSKLIEEISAFANTYGGYIFLGVADDKTIVGCKEWNEQRIFSVIHDSISPTPSFDVKKFQFGEDKVIYILRIDEGAEPPYITNKGMIYERISSSSCVVKDSNKLSQMFLKRKEEEKAIEKKITITDVNEKVNNIWGYIDIGFALTARNRNMFIEKFYEANLEELLSGVFEEDYMANVVRVGNSIVFSFRGLKSANSNNLLPAHLNNFVEIMSDGSVRLRILLSNNNPSDSSVNMVLPLTFLTTFSKVYRYIFESILEDEFVYAKKYEKLTVNKQFTVLYDEGKYIQNSDEEAWNRNKKILELQREHIEKTGEDLVVTDNRIPKVGFFTIDKKAMEEDNFEYNTDNIINSLFTCRYMNIDYIFDRDEI